MSVLHKDLRHLTNKAEVDAGEHDDLAHPVGRVAPGQHTLTPHQHSIITEPHVVLLFPNGQWWGDTASLEAFTKDLLERGYLDGLKPYGVSRGVYVGKASCPPVTGTITDNQCQLLIKNMINSGKAPSNGPNMLYVLCLPAGVGVTDGSDANCTAFCGYHSAFTNNDGQIIAYSVQPATTCAPCNGGNTPFAAFTMVLAHEIAEAATDRWPGQGWYVDDPNDPQNGQENADLVAWNVHHYGRDNEWTVQGYYTNEAGDTVGVWQPAQQPNPNPDPDPNIPAPGFELSLPFWWWVIRNESRVMDAVQAADTNPDHKSVLVAWNDWMVANKFRIS